MSVDVTRVCLTLPVPPSANRLWRNGKGRTYKDKAAVAYNEAVYALCLQAGYRKPLWPKTTPLRVSLTWYRQVRKGDLDNRAKATLDALRRIIYVDDAQVSELHLYRVDGQRPGRVEVTIEPLTP